MRKSKLILPIIAFCYLLVGIFLFAYGPLAKDMNFPAAPTIIGWSYDQTNLGKNTELKVGLYNPVLDVRVNPYAGESVCSVETSLAFPKDLIEVKSVNFSANDNNSYSNENGTINFKATLTPCSTITGLELFDVTFVTKKIGRGNIHFINHVITGGGDDTTILKSGAYSDVPVNIVAVKQDNPEPKIINPLPGIPANIPKPQVQTVTSSTINIKVGTKSSSSVSAAEKTATMTENSAFKTPVLSKLEFDSKAVLDKSNSRSKGVVFTGTAEPSSKVSILIHSQTEIYTDTTAGADGSWRKIIDDWLEDGGHTITIWSEKDNKISSKLNSNFVISSYASDQIAIGSTYPKLKGEGEAKLGLNVKKMSKVGELIKNIFFWIYIGGGLVLIAVIFILTLRSKRYKNGSDDGYVPKVADSINPFDSPRSS